ncbi:MAG TPA: RusA family crossover junction endodeoxyribonuclease [Nitrospiraceae bacterium]|nr:RusA family crossover junction endodeoxyribonuclease [Nitrospiraceae bacterium]
MALTYVGSIGKKYQQTIRELLLERQAWFRSPHPLFARFVICFRDERKQDLDNRLKVAIDALKNGNLFLDDSQIEHIEVRRGPTMKNGAMFVWIEEFVPDRGAALRWVKTPI